MIPAPLNAVRLMALGPGAVSKAHCDPKYRLDRGLVRLHIPIVTDPQAVLVLDGVEQPTRWPSARPPMSPKVRTRCREPDRAWRLTSSYPRNGFRQWS
ncbi:hypothetical protein ACFYT4_33205 [Streptomyces sp. NPDC004609]|uniref:hypothetical protein n=1 Tax=Streptomyces sp. NPDC004609 TaxID=3364704 RepID=UPI0036BB977A